MDGRNIDAWMIARQDILSDYAANPLKNKQANIIAPLVVFDIALAIAIFLNAAVLKRQLDIFNVLGLFDIVVTSLYIFTVIINVARCNELSRRYHSRVLERYRYKIARRMFVTKTDLTPLRKVNILLTSAISRVEKLAEPVRLLGFVVNDELLYSFFGLVLAGVSAAISKFYFYNAT